ncbi:MAG: hypothetical protein Q9182_005255 [Xanthomendoza sp. 2 TL-2023]
MFMDLPVSGIHRLFSAASSSQSYRPPPLESVTEESHTYDLLYPDFNALQQSQDQIYPLRRANPSSTASAANGYDDRGALDIHTPRDIRIIVAQDGSLSQQAKVIFDTHPPPKLPHTRLGSPVSSKAGQNREIELPAALSRRTYTTPASPTKSKHSRFSSLNQIRATSPVEQPSPLSPFSEPYGAFGNARPRQSSTRPATSEGETHQNKLAREGKEEVESLLDSMFGSTGSTLTSGTKVHVRPAGTTQARNSSQYEANPRSPEPGASRRRRTPLTRSTTANDMHLLSTSAPAEPAGLSRAWSQSPLMIITRLFTIDHSEILSSRSTTEQGQPTPANPGGVHQDSPHVCDPSSLHETTTAKQIRCPGFAFALLLRLPHSPHPGWSSASQTVSPILHEMPGHSNFGSDGQWYEGKLSSADREVEQITIHWSLIMRLLNSFEAVMRKRISDLLADVNMSSPGQSSQSLAQDLNRDLRVASKFPVEGARRRFQRPLQLPVDALQHLADVQRCAGQFGERVAVALRTRRVITGQGRWGIWREEARWVGRWAGSREQNFFFFNLLTAFLGSHTEWLESLDGLRTRQSCYRSGYRGEATRLCRRQTVIVSADKMAARRLIFLLSAFLNRTVPPMQDNLLLPTTAWLGSPFSPSPPSSLRLLRKQSLRREINRRQRGNWAPHGPTGPNGRSLSFSGPEDSPDQDENHMFRSTNGQHLRRASDARSIKSPALPTAASEGRARKSSTTTYPTILPDGPLPVAHFSSVSRDPLIGTAPVPRPGSSGSLASLSLKQTLQRSESNEHSNASTGSQSFSRWGSLVSGFWSNRRGSSPDDVEIMGSPPEGLGISGVSKMPARTSSPGTLARMVEEADAVPPIEPPNRRARQRLPEFSESAIVGDIDMTDEQPKSTHLTKAGLATERRKAEQCLEKLSVDDQDGIIDLDIPCCASSFGSSAGSMGCSHTATSSFNDRYSAFTGSPNKERSQPLSSSPSDVAGWLKEYNPDFSLQAVRPYPDLNKDIHEALRSESAAQSLATNRASSVDPATADWTDVMSILVANTTTFSITRVRLQHRSKMPTTVDPSSGHSPSEPSKQQQQPPPMEERITEDRIMDMDPTLIDAIERVLAQSGQSSRAPSPSARIPKSSDVPPPPHLEVPKSECKRLVLGALEEIVRSVQAEQEGGGRRISGEPVRRGEEEGEVEVPDSTLREGVRRWVRGFGRSP